MTPQLVDPPGRPMSTRRASQPGSTFKIWVPYCEVTGESIHFNQLLRLLSTLKLDAVLLHAARINWYINHPESPSDAQLRMASQYLEEATREKIDAWVANKRKDLAIDYVPPVFHRQQLLSVMRWAAFVCSEDGAEVSGEASHTFGRCCLMMNEFLHSPRAGRTEGPATREDHLAWVPPVYELCVPPGFVHAIIRARTLALSLLPATPNGPAYLEAFRKATSLELERYMSLVFAIWSLLMDSTKLPTAAIPIIDPSSSFWQAAIPPAEWELLFARQAWPIDHLGDHLYASGYSAAYYDFRDFRQRPFVQTKTRQAICLDLGLLAEGMSENVFWIIHQLLGHDDRDAFASAWGKAFESYTRELLTGMYPPASGLYFPNPKWVGGKEMADGLLYDGDTLVIMETKGAYLSARAKYSGDSYLIRAELGRKFIEKKGVAQLAKSVRCLVGTHAPRHLAPLGIDANRVRRILPVMIVLDRLLGAPLVGWFLSKKLREALSGLANARGVAVGPLIVLTAEDFENIEANRDPLGIFEMLRRKAGADPMHDQNFGDFARAEIWPTGRKGNERIRGEFDEWGRNLIPIIMGEKAGGAHGGPITS